METITYKKYVWYTGILALVCISFAAFTFGLGSLDSIKHPNGQVASISVSGDGEVTAVPDIATIVFTVRESAKTVPDAQKLTETKIAKGLKELEALGVDKKDTKTFSYSVNPKYETVSCTMYSCPPSVSSPKIIGYEVTQSISVKVRKVEQAGEVFGVLGKANITEMTGPDFTVDDLEKVQADAKAIAIKKAQEKATVLANSLGVSLGSIISFSDDSNNGGYYPMYAKAMSSDMVSSQAVSLPQGENVIKSRVTITYTLK